MIPKTKTVEYLMKEAAEASRYLDRVSDFLAQAKERLAQAEADVKGYEMHLITASKKVTETRTMLKEQGLEDWEMP